MRNEEFELLLQKASIGCCKKEELLEAKERLESHLEDVNAQCAEYEQVIQMMDLEGKNTDNPEEVRKAMESYGIENPQIAIDELKNLRESRNITAHYISAFSDALAEFRNFDKYICFNNIRTLLKVNSDVKIGMIEKEAGVRLGYMSAALPRLNRRWSLCQRLQRCWMSALTFWCRLILTRLHQQKNMS